MKSFRNFAIAILLLGAIAAEGNLSRFLQDIESSSRYDAVFFKSVALPSGSVAARRTPAETRAELGKLIQAAPAEADLYSLRALEAEAQLDFNAAEADWTKFVELAADKAAANVALADYYHRRLQPRSELAALNAAATPAAYERSIQLIEAQALDAALIADQYKAWLRKEPRNRQLYTRALTALNARKNFNAAQDVVNTYRATFPEDREYAARALADIEYAKGNSARAAQIWDESFDPLWPGETLSRYFEITGAGRDRQLLGRLEQAVTQKPEDLAAAAKVYHLRQRLNNPAGARRALTDFRTRKKNWTPQEWLTLGRLFEAAAAPNEAARCYHALYIANNEQGLVEVTRLLLDMPDQPIQLGAGDLALYRDIATMDQGPGYLNGVLSLILNNEGVPWQFDQQNQAARAYFHRAKASELLDVLNRRFPSNPSRATLSAKLIQSYATYGDRAGVIRAGRQFLQTHASSPERMNVTFLMADAFAATNQPNDEIAAYDALLKELAAKAGGVPVGSGGTVRSPDYVRALDRYMARLVTLKRLQQALAVYRQEIDRNSGDPGLYERFAAFLDQNKLGAEVEQVYKQALQKFQDDTWSDKLARWYLKRKQLAQFETLTRDVTKTFSGSALEKYFRSVVAGSGVGAAMNLQLNLYANLRFPHNLTFVRNLLAAYETRGTADPAAYERLLRQHWFEADDLRSRFFQLLSRTNRLQTELDAIRAMNPKPEENAVAARMLAEGEIWRTRYEAAAAPMRAIAAVFPSDSQADTRAAMLHRSLNQFDVAANIEQNLAKAAPRDTGALTRLGEMQADRERYAAAKPFWDRIPDIEPGRDTGVIETATLYWDYFQFDDALRTIDAGRKRLNNTALAGYEAGAIYENKREYPRAIEEYLKAALTEDGAGGRAKSRLLRLARRNQLKDAVERAVNARSTSPDDLKSVDLRVALLESQNRRADLEAFLTSLAARSTSEEVLVRTETAASLNAMPNVERRAMERRIELATDATAQLRARLQFMRFLEARNDNAAAARIVEDAYRQNPYLLGVVRAAVNFHWRNKNSARAIAILTESADRAKGELPSRLRYEAASKALESANYTAAKRLIDGLLQQEPTRNEYLSLGADYYARQNDDAGLRAFYVKSIETLRAAKLPVDTLRQNLIPVLHRQKDFAGAVDQYIELLNRFPEDPALARDAARYAAANNQQPKLTGFYAKTVNDSPKDYRWPLVLSRLQLELNDLDGALASLAKATAIRPDRTDLMIARATIEERSLRFEDALKSYQKIWDLSYRNPSWLEKAAEQHLRLGRTDQAVTTLKQAYLDSQPDSPERYAQVARKLLDWNLVAAARDFAPKATADVQAAVALRNRQPVAATYPEQSTGEILGRYYTPKERAVVAPTLRGDRGLSIARAAGWKDTEAALLAASVKGNDFYSLVNLQRQRARFDDLGQQLLTIAANNERAGENKGSILREAARAYQASGNAAGELRVLTTMAGENLLSGEELTRYGILMVRQGRAAALAADPKQDSGVRDAMVNASVFAAKPADAFAILSARGRSPLWTNAYTALAGVYIGASKDPAVQRAFESILGTQSIGEQLARKADRNLQLTGRDWFYYAARFGENIPSATGDFIAADLESAPGNTNLYIQLGDYYLERGEYAKAKTEYEYALQLNPQLADVTRKVALTLFAAGQREEALAAWRQALANERVNLASLLADAAAAKTIEALRPEIDQAARRRLRYSGSYEADTILQPLAAVDFNWVLDLANAAQEPSDVLSALFYANWLTPQQSDAVLNAAVAASDRKARATLGESREMALVAAARWRVEEVRGRLDRGDFAGASAILKSLTPDVRARQNIRFDEFAIRAASGEGKLDPRAMEDVPLETLERVAASLDSKAAAPILEFAYRRELDHHNYSAAAFLGLAKIRIEQNSIAEAVELLRRMNYVVGEPFSVTELAGDLLLAQNRPQEAREFLEMFAKAKPWDPKARLQLARVTNAEAGMRAVAESSDAPYAIRCEAALALRQLKANPLQIAGETELNLLSSQTAITEQQANTASPNAFELRKLAASQSKDANVRYRLLTAALAIRPDEHQIRREAFRAAIQTRRFTSATSLLDSNAAETEDQKLLADAYLRLGRNDEATSVAQQLLDAGASGARRLLELARNALDLEHMNQQRMPVFQQNYDQDRVVRPKLAALPRRGGVQ